MTHSETPGSGSKGQDFGARFTSFFRPKILPVIQQAELTECGLACLAMVMSYHGFKIDMCRLRQEYSVSQRGQTLGQLMALGESYGLHCRPLKVKLERLKSLVLPAILHWNLNHFVVLKKVTATRLTIHDPAVGLRVLTWQQVSDHFTGVALELMPGMEFKTQDQTSRPKFYEFFQNVPGLKSGLAQLVTLSLILLLFAAAAPLGTQLILDKVLVHQDVNWLIILTSALLLAAVTGAVVSLLRSYLLIHLTQILNFHLSANVLRHLVYLPLNWFEKRHMGDVMSRFSSTEQIREILTGTLVSSLLDSAMAVVMIVFMLFYSVKLTLIALAFVAVYIVGRLILFPVMRQMTDESLQASAKASSNFMETVRGIQSVKIFGKEGDRRSLWQKQFMDVIQVDTRLGRISARYETFEDILQGVETAIITYLAALLVFDQEFTAGMFVAFFSYQGQFSEKASALVGNLIEYKMLDLHIDRLTDIVTSPKEKYLSPQSTGERPKLKGALELRNVSFRYSDRDPWIFKDLNLTLAAGECLAISGPSGCGKTTLVKIMLGLLEPLEGVLLIDGHDYRQLGLAHYRQHIAAVMQDDQLFSGTITNNITFFDTNPDEERARECARLAAVADDIAQMPMGYGSLVGDMGSALSGGQKQRIILARALYRKPTLLFLDEATSHLDVYLEQSISEAIKTLAITRVIISHRPETLQLADRVIWMMGGGEFEVHHNNEVSPDL